MTEPEILDQIHTLQRWLKAAWRRLGDPALTTFERRELRNQMKEADAALRQYLVLSTELKSAQWRRGRPETRTFARPDLRFLA